MAENSGISWTDHTFNPWIGCQKVSPACDNCYAERLVTQRMGREWGPGAERRRTKPANWNLPRRWDRAAAKAGVAYIVFCASLADVFDNAVPQEWREDLFVLIRETPNLIWMLLTKRPTNMAKMLPPDWGAGYPNVRLGVTTEDQHWADRRIPVLLDTPAAGRFVSAEPLTGRVVLGEWADALDLVITGGESGPGARPTPADWYRNLRDECAASGTLFHFKQWGEHDATGARVGVKQAGRYLDGVEHLARFGEADHD